MVGVLSVEVWNGTAWTRVTAPRPLAYRGRAELLRIDCATAADQSALVTGS